MWTYHPELLATPVPRYTSYPTAAEFHDGIGGGDMAQALDAVAPDALLSLYVHIPYCRDICWYCGCNTGAANRAQRLAAYLEALGSEIDLVARRLNGRGRVTRIAFGGGSPNAIGAVDFVRLVDRLATQFDTTGAKLSVELDPRGLNPSWIAAMAACGVERVSLGVQTLAPAVQEAIGRVQPTATIRAAVQDLRRAGIGSINFDLMYGLPGQSITDLEDSLAKTVAMSADRVALFGYAHVPQLVPRQRRIDAGRLPGPLGRFLQAGMGHDLLTGAGYQAVGFDHFALPGDTLAAAARAGAVRRNFQGFTDDPAELVLGLGASAISCFPDRLIQNEKNVGRYRMLALACQMPGVRGIMRSTEDQQRGAIIEALLCRGEADIETLCIGEVARRLRPFMEKDLVAMPGAKVVLAPDALPYARSIAATFDRYRDPAGQRFSHAI